MGVKLGPCKLREERKLRVFENMVLRRIFGPRRDEVLVGKPEGKRPVGRPRRRWVDNIRMDLQEVGCGYMDWIGLTQVAEACECGNEPSGSVKCGEFLD